MLAAFDRVDNKSCSLMVKKKFQNKHSRGSRSNSKQYSWPAAYYGELSGGESERNHRSKTQPKVFRSYARKCKNRILRQYYKELVHDELIHVNDDSDDEYSECLGAYIENDAVSLEDMNISISGKRKICQFDILQTYILPILKQLHPTYFCNRRYWGRHKLYQTITLDNIHKYLMMKTNIKCIVSEHILRRLDLINHYNSNFKPEIVYTSKYLYKNRIDMSVFCDKDVIKLYGSINFFDVIVNGYCQSMPQAIQQLILSFHGENVMDIFKSFVYITGISIMDVKKFLFDCKNILICLSLWNTNYNNKSRGGYSMHFAIPLVNIKLSKIHKRYDGNRNYV